VREGREGREGREVISKILYHSNPLATLGDVDAKQILCAEGIPKKRVLEDGVIYKQKYQT
jgi:hypothetical protein